MSVAKADETPTDQERFRGSQISRKSSNANDDRQGTTCFKRLTMAMTASSWVFRSCTAPHVGVVRDAPLPVWLPESRTRWVLQRAADCATRGGGGSVSL